MDTEFLNFISDISWAGVIALSIIFIVKPLIAFIIAKFNGKSNNDKINQLDKVVNNEMTHDIQRIDTDINEIWKEIREIKEQLMEIKTCLKIKNIL
jgi:peptidoglycan hydrolase CwlO-like protein